MRLALTHEQSLSPNGQLRAETLFEEPQPLGLIAVFHKAKATTPQSRACGCKEPGKCFHPVAALYLHKYSQFTTCSLGRVIPGTAMVLHGVVGCSGNQGISAHFHA